MIVLYWHIDMAGDVIQEGVISSDMDSVVRSFEARHGVCAIREGRSAKLILSDGGSVEIELEG